MILVGRHVRGVPLDCDEETLAVAVVDAVGIER